MQFVCMPVRGSDTHRLFAANDQWVFFDTTTRSCGFLEATTARTPVAMHSHCSPKIILLERRITSHHDGEFCVVSGFVYKLE